MTQQFHLSYQSIPTLAQILPAYPGVKGLFFDMDGTLFNTEKYHTMAMLAIGAQYKITPPYSPDAVHQLMMGKADHLVFELIKDWPGFPSQWHVKDFVDAKNEQFFKVLLDVQKTDYFPQNMQTLLDQAQKQGLYLALITSSEKIVTQKLLKLAGLEHFFEVVLTRDDCALHKPDPFPYLKALKISGLKAEETLIFEDSKVGLTAAEASGCRVIKAEWY